MKAKSVDQLFTDKENQDVLFQFCVKRNEDFI